MRIPSIASCATALTLFFAVLAGSPVLLSAQSPAQSRITPNLASSARVVVPNTVVPRAKAAVDLGPAPFGAVLASVKLRFNLTSAQSAALGQLVAAQQNPSSPLYHQWLTLDQYASQFGLSHADIASVTAWLESHGLAVTEVARSRTFIAVSGTAAQIESAFAVPIHSVSLNGEAHIANLADPTLPAPIAAVVSGITGLNDFHLKPRARVHREIAPEYTSSSTANHYIAPGDFYTIYDVNPLLTSSINGSGVTIAVVGQTDLSLSDVAAFRSASGLSSNLPTVKLYPPDPGLSTADIDEAQLDVEWSGAVAPSAAILYINSTDAISGSLTEAIDNDLAPIVSISYGDCESGWGASELAVYQQLFLEANVQGQTIVGAGGDDGATDCDFDATIASGGVAVDYPASSPFVTGVGGSMFAENGGGYWSTTNGSYAGSALSYIPETVWNETATYGSLAAGGGGASAFFTKPSFQIGTGVPNDFSRDVPDLVLNTGVIHDGYLLCSRGWCTNGFRDAANYLDIVGGTSVAAPTFAGILALLEQKIKASLGNANPVLYGLANSTYASTVFRDIATGNNDTPCVAGSPNCPNGGSIGYSAGVGYDLASGWGSVDAFHLVSDWLLATPTGLTGATGQTPSSTIMVASTGSAIAGTNVILSALVGMGVRAGSSPAPTGTVQFLVDNVPNGSPVTVANSAAGFTLVTTAIAAGPHIVTGAYSGDITYAGSKAAVNLTIVANVAAGFSLTPSTGSTTVASGGSAPGVTFTITAVNGFTGSVAFSASSASGSLPATYSFSVNPVVVTSTAAAGTTLTMLAYVPNAQTSHGLLRFGAPLLGLLIFLAPRRRRRLIALAVTVLSAAMLTSTGCGSSTPAAAVPNVTNTPAGTYSILVTATAANAAGTVVTHNSTVTFIVQ